MICIANDKILLSSCCGKYIFYTGSGYEFCTTCGKQCDYHCHFFRRKQKHMQQLLKKKNNKRLEFFEHNSKINMKIKKSLHKKKLNAANAVDVRGNVEVQQQCYFCHQKNIYQTLNILDVSNRSIIKCCLCFKHLVPDNICNQILDIQSLTRFVQCNSSQKCCKTDFDIQFSNKIPSILHTSLPEKSKRGRKRKYLTVQQPQKI